VRAQRAHGGFDRCPGADHVVDDHPRPAAHVADDVLGRHTDRVQAYLLTAANGAPTSEAK
jgi:hypothetical protein